MVVRAKPRIKFAHKMARNMNGNIKGKGVVGTNESWSGS